MKKNCFCSNNMLWILILMIVVLLVSITIMPMNAAEKAERKIETKSNASVSADSQNALCRKVSMLIKNNDIVKYAAKSKRIPGRPQDSEYIDLDVDADGIVDKIEVSSGSEGSYLGVKLSGGGQYDLEENGFVMIVKFDEQVYALVTYWEWSRQPDGSKKGKEVGHRLYLLAKQSAKVICDHF